MADIDSRIKVTDVSATPYKAVVKVESIFGGRGNDTLDGGEGGRLTSIEWLRFADRTIATASLLL